MFPSPAEIKLCYGHEVAPKCPRCESSNTKFCYYNNYSSSQPRYYCKNCRRNWTQGGSLRNIPAGGGCGKRRRSSRSRRFGEKENQSDHHDRDSPCPEIDMAVVFANYLNGQSPNSSTDHNTTRSEQGLCEFLEEDMFDFQGLLNDKEIQDILNCSVSELNPINDDHWSSPDLAGFGI